MSSLPSWIKPDTADAYNHAYTMLYCARPADIRAMIDKHKSDDSSKPREVVEFMKEVVRMAQFEMSHEDLKALERREKMEGIHPSQQKKVEPPAPPKTNGRVSKLKICVVWVQIPHVPPFYTVDIL